MTQLLRRRGASQPGRSSNGGVWKCLGIGVAVIAFLMILGSIDNESSKNASVRGGTRHQRGVEITRKTPPAIKKAVKYDKNGKMIEDSPPPPLLPRQQPQNFPINDGDDDISSFSADSQDLDETVAALEGDMLEEEQGDIEEASESILSSALKKVQDGVKFALGGFFADSDDISQDDLEAIADEVVKRLREDVDIELRQKADEIMQEEEEEVEGAVEEEKRLGKKKDEIIEEVGEVGEAVTTDMKKKINKAAEEMKGKLKEKAAKIEQEVIEKKLKKKVKREGDKLVKEKKIKKDDTEVERVEKEKATKKSEKTEESKKTNKERAKSEETKDSEKSKKETAKSEKTSQSAKGVKDEKKSYHKSEKSEKPKKTLKDLKKKATEEKQ